MKIRLLTCSSTQEEWLKILETQYTKKISHHFDFAIEALPSVKSLRQDRVQRAQAESLKIQSYLKRSDMAILFDESGKDMDSMVFADVLNRQLLSGKQRLVFIIGGPYGVSDTLKKHATLRIRLSGMTLNHLVAEAVALEQIYRAISILKGLPYHNDAL